MRDPVATCVFSLDKSRFFIAFFCRAVDIIEMTLATGVPREVIVISSPLLTSRSKLEKLRLAFDAVIVFMVLPLRKVGYNTTLF